MRGRCRDDYQLVGGLPRRKRRRHPTLSLHPRVQRNHPPRLPRCLRLGQHGAGRGANFGANERSRAHRARTRQHQHMAQRPVPTHVSGCQRSAQFKRRGRQRGFHGKRGGAHGRAKRGRHRQPECVVRGRGRNERKRGNLFCRQTAAQPDGCQPHAHPCRKPVQQTGQRRASLQAGSPARNPAPLRHHYFLHRQRIARDYTRHDGARHRATHRQPENRRL